MASRSQPASKMSPNVSKCLQNVSKMSPYVSLETFSPSTGYTKLKFLTPSLLYFRMSFTYGPRYDHGCMAILKDDEKYILTVGGWNNSAMAVSELYSVKDERWSVELISSKNSQNWFQEIFFSFAGLPLNTIQVMSIQMESRFTRKL